MAKKGDKFEKKSFLEKVKPLPRVDLEQVLEEDCPVIFDTNFLFVPFEFPVDIIAEMERLLGTQYELFIYEGTLYELSDIEKKGDKNKKFLPLIISMLERFDFKIISSDNRYVDGDILKNAQHGILVATNDSQLRKQLWSIPSRVMYMRQKRYLEIS